MLDTAALYAALSAKREKSGFSWRELAAEWGVSPSTFTRLKEGRVPEISFLLHATSWLGADLKDFLAPPEKKHPPLCGNPVDATWVGFSPKGAGCGFLEIDGGWILGLRPGQGDKGEDPKKCYVVTRHSKIALGAFVCPLPPPLPLETPSLPKRPLPPFRPCNYPPSYDFDEEFGVHILEGLIGRSWRFVLGFEMQGCVLVLSTTWEVIPVGSFVCPLPPPSAVEFS